MGKYVAVGVLAVIVLAAVTYEPPEKTLARRDQPAEGRFEGTFGTAPAGPVQTSPPALPPGPAAEPMPAPQAQPPAPPQAQPATPAPTEPPLREYVVKKGQTLCDVAEELLGDRSRWKELYEQNKERLPDPDTLRAGMRIVCKFAASAAQTTADRLAPQPATQTTPQPVAQPAPAPERLLTTSSDR